MGNRGIADARRTSVDAVKFHVANLLEKLDVRDRRELRNWRGGPADSAYPAGRDQMTGPQASFRADSASLNLGPIGQVSRHVRDIRAAEEWYKNVLGLRHLFTFGNLAFFDCGGTRLFLSIPENDEKPHGESILYFRVEDIQHAQDMLAARGVHFRGAPHLIHRHRDGTEEWMTFFDDLDGGVLALMEQVKQAG
jgi:catechol 2,3-dioxygenase-like lactoylglutathione lyase family enzyme